MTDSEAAQAEHNIDGAVYRLQPDGTKYGKHMPTLECSCGFWTRDCDDWEEAGWKMDQHLKAL